MKQKPPIPFFSNENFENLIRWHRANLLELENDRSKMRFALEMSPESYCKRHGIEPMESIEDTLQAVLRADKGYQRELYRVGRIQVFLDSLSPEEAEFIKLRYLQDKQWEEVGKALNIAGDTAKKRWRTRLLDRAKKIMIEPIKKEG